MGKKKEKGNLFLLLKTTMKGFGEMENNRELEFFLTKKDQY